jgi:hypothetical protein
VSGVISAGSIIVGGDNISALVNDEGYTDFSAVDVEAAIANNVTVIDGSKITTGQVNAANIDVSGVISAGSIIVGGDNISALTNDAGYTDFSAVDVEAAIANNVTVISGSKITTGTIDASEVTVINLSASSITVGTIQASQINVTDLAASTAFIDALTVNKLTAGTVSPTVVRTEITPATGTEYVIWSGVGPKDDDGIFWVKANGTAKIDKNVFDIGAIPNKGVASDSLTTGITSSSNGVTAEFSSFTSNGQPVLFEVSFSFFAFNNESDPASCDLFDPATGTLVLQRKIGGGSYSTISSASFFISSNTFFLESTEPLVDDICRTNHQGEANRSLIDSNPPSDGTANVQYRIVISNWDCPLLASFNITGVVDTNAINAAFTQ